MNDIISIGTLVMMSGSKDNEIGIVVDQHHIKAWPHEMQEPRKYKIIYKINIINKNLFKYCYSYEMVILSE